MDQALYQAFVNIHFFNSPTSPVPWNDYPHCSDENTKAKVIQQMKFGLYGSLEMGLTIAEDEMWKRIRAIISPTFTSRKLKEMFPLIKHHGDILMQNIEKKVSGDEAMNMKVVAPFPCAIAGNDECDSASWEGAGILCECNILRSKEHVDFLQLMIDSQATDIPESSEANQFPKAYNLATHPEVQEGLQKEIDSALPNKVTWPESLYEASNPGFLISRFKSESKLKCSQKADLTYEVLFHMEYLDMVVNETLWLFPLGGHLERVFKKTVEINGVTIPKGRVVIIPTYVLHRDPEYWSEPEEFCPERFSKDNKKRLDPYVFLPLGAGPQNCIGMRFTLLALKASLVLLLQNFSLETCRESPVPLEVDSSSFMVPKKPIFLKLIPRMRTASQE
ncbi:cytochrome P450 3A24-like [Trichechus inunguis]